MKPFTAALAFLPGMIAAPVTAQTRTLIVPVFVAPVDRSLQKDFTACLQGFGTQIPAAEKAQYQALTTYFRPSSTKLGFVMMPGKSMFLREGAPKAFAWLSREKKGVVYDVKSKATMNLPQRTSLFFGICLKPGSPA